MIKPMLAPSSKKQEMFVRSHLEGYDYEGNSVGGADITIFGGAAGAGKSHMLLMSALPFVHMKHYRGVVIRRTTPQLRGSVFDAAKEMYGSVAPSTKIRDKDMQFIFESGATVKMIHQEHTKSKYDIQGWEISQCLIDEVQQLPEENFLYAISRLRTKADMNAHLKASCNPDYDTFLRKYLEDAGYLDKEGFPREDMCGVITFCGQIDGKMTFRLTRELWDAEFPSVTPMKFMFIGATCKDNPKLLEMEPTYLSKLENLPRVERDRLLYGNWFAREQASGYFKREWVGDPISTYQVPRGCRIVRAWDLACTLPSEEYSDPDWTVGVKMAKDDTGNLYILDVVRFRERPAKVNQTVLETALIDGEEVTVVLPQDPGAAGKVAFDHLASALFDQGFTVRKAKTERAKLKRFEPFAAMAENGMVKVVKGDWNDKYFDELEVFDGGKKHHDDQVDATSDAAKELCNGRFIPTFAVPVGFTKDNPFAINS